MPRRGSGAHLLLLLSQPLFAWHGLRMDWGLPVLSMATEVGRQKCEPHGNADQPQLDLSAPRTYPHRTPLPSRALVAVGTLARDSGKVRAMAKDLGHLSLAQQLKGGGGRPGEAAAEVERVLRL